MRREITNPNHSVVSLKKRCSHRSNLDVVMVVVSVICGVAKEAIVITGTKNFGRVTENLVDGVGTDREVSSSHRGVRVLRGRLVEVRGVPSNGTVTVIGGGFNTDSGSRYVIVVLLLRLLSLDTVSVRYGEVSEPHGIDSHGHPANRVLKVSETSDRKIISVMVTVEPLVGRVHDSG